MITGCLVRVESVEEWYVERKAAVSAAKNAETLYAGDMRSSLANSRSVQRTDCTAGASGSGGVCNEVVFVDNCSLAFVRSASKTFVAGVAVQCSGTLWWHYSVVVHGGIA